MQIKYAMAIIGDVIYVITFRAKSSGLDNGFSRRNSNIIIKNINERRSTPISRIMKNTTFHFVSGFCKNKRVIMISNNKNKRGRERVQWE